MSPETTGIVGIAVLLFLFLLRMPVGFAMALVGVTGFAYLSGLESALALLAQDIYETFSSYPLSVIPLFILMGSFAFASGISQRLYRTTHSWVGSYRRRSAVRRPQRLPPWGKLHFRKCENTNTIIPWQPDAWQLPGRWVL
jgi:TRAP-type mannitol/chloroaromatic compound transport system permease large subunit